MSYIFANSDLETAVQEGAAHWSYCLGLRWQSLLEPGHDARKHHVFGVPKGKKAASSHVLEGMW